MCEALIKNDLVSALDWHGSVNFCDQIARIEGLISHRVEDCLARLPRDHLLFKERGAIAALKQIVNNPYLGAIALGEVDAGHEAMLYFIARALSEIDGENSRENNSLEWGASSISLSSDILIPPMDRGGTQLADHEKGEIDCIRQKIRNGFGLLEEYNSAGALLVKNFIWILALRRELDEPNAFSSGTFQTAPGLVLICNSQLDRIGGLDIAESLLHEAIHCYLFWAEDPMRRILANGVDYRERISSPWSGASIGVHSAVHAVAVWYGLMTHFSMVAHSRNALHRRFALDRVQFIKDGFRSDRFKPFADILHERCSDFGNSILLEIEHRVGRV